MITPQQERILKIAESGGNDSSLFLLNLIHELEDKIDKTGVPALNELLESVKLLIAKEMPSPIFNVAPPVVHVHPRIEMPEMPEMPVSPAPVINIPAPIVNVKAEVMGERTDPELIEKIDELSRQVKELQDRGISRPIFGPGKTKIALIDLSSQLNGATKTFSLGITHFGIISVQGSSAPFGAFRPIVDYNEVGKTIVFTANVDAPSALPAGQSLVIKVLK